MTDTWPPSAETLERWAKIADDNEKYAFYASASLDAKDRAAFLRDPRLREALELAEAMAWCVEHAWSITRYPGHALKPWRLQRAGDEDVWAVTLPEAVRALRAKIEKEGA